MSFNIDLSKNLQAFDRTIEFALEQAANFSIDQAKDFIIDKTGGEFNLPVFAPLIFEPLIKTNLVLPPLRIDAVTVTATRNKHIVKTKIEGRDNTIKEHISNGDFTIDINGLIAEDRATEDYPKGKLFLLKQFLDAPYALPITHAILNRLGVYEIVIDSYSIPSIQGTKNIQKFTAKATSDEFSEIIIRNNA